MLRSLFLTAAFATPFGLFAQSGASTASEFSPYSQVITGTKVSFKLVPIQGGEFTMGSPANEPSRKEDEGPQHRVKVEAFWMGQYEVSWDEYELFVYPDMEKNASVASAGESKPANASADAVSRPSPPYIDMTNGMGKNGFPAVNMTQYAALMYCKWLTAKTGVFYRLPTEAEWEYACRAGTSTAYSFSNDPAQLNDYAWSYQNSNSAYHKVGTKKPNPWNLYDMHGNAAEWTLDQYAPDTYAKAGKGTVTNPWVKADKLYPQVIRGGSWDDDPDRLRSAARLPSNPKWKQRDPQIPKSNWWFTDASFIGFRIVRPVNKPSKEEIAQYFAGPIKDLY